MLVDASSPWSQQWVNAGKINNKGIEFTLYTTPVKTKDFTFDLNINLAHNVSTVDELADGVSRIYFAGDSHMPVKVGAVTGGKLGDIYANKLMKRDANGNIIVDANGLPQPETGDGNQEQWLLNHPIGNIQPKLLMSVMPSFNYKGIVLSATFTLLRGAIVCKRKIPKPLIFTCLSFFNASTNWALKALRNRFASFSVTPARLANARRNSVQLSLLSAIMIRSF